MAHYPLLLIIFEPAIKAKQGKQERKIEDRGTIVAFKDSTIPIHPSLLKSRSHLLGGNAPAKTCIGSRVLSLCR